MISPAKIATVTQSYAVSIRDLPSRRHIGRKSTPEPRLGAHIGRLARIGLLTLAVLVAACNRDEAPSGQVIAIVDGEEITTAELNEEARARNLPIGKDPAARQAVVQELIDRTLLAQEAKRQNLDRSPTYLLAVRRLQQIALAQQLLAADAGQAAAPSPEEVQRFIAVNPRLFGDRLFLSVDRIVIPAGASSALREALSQAASVDQMERIAESAGIRSSRATETWDSASLPDTFTAVSALSPAETFVIAGPTGVVAGKLLSVLPQPVPPEQRVALARSMMNQKASEHRLQAKLQELRSTADVQLQPEPGPSPAGE